MHPVRRLGGVLGLWACTMAVLPMGAVAQDAAMEAGGAVPSVPAPWEPGGQASALACARAHFPAALSTPLNPRALDGRAIDHAVRAEVNHHRCLAGLEPVGPSDALSLAATRRAIEDAADPGGAAAVPADSAAADAGFMGFVGETLASPSWLDVPASGAVADPALGRCGYRDAQGAVVGAPSVARFAEIVVGGWVEEPGAAAVLMAPDARFMGAGVAFGPAVAPCGGVHTVAIAAG